MIVEILRSPYYRFGFFIRDFSSYGLSLYCQRKNKKTEPKPNIENFFRKGSLIIIENILS